MCVGGGGLREWSVSSGMRTQLCVSEGGGDSVSGVYPVECGPSYVCRRGGDSVSGVYPVECGPSYVCRRGGGDSVSGVYPVECGPSYVCRRGGGRLREWSVSSGMRTQLCVSEGGLREWSVSSGMRTQLCVSEGGGGETPGERKRTVRLEACSCKTMRRKDNCPGNTVDKRIVSIIIVNKVV